MRNQTKIKVTLAKVFADAELEEFENNSINEGQNQTVSQQPPMYLSPAYSAISDADGSSETILITEEQPVLVVEESTHEPSHEDAIDLTNHNSNESQ